MSLARNVLAIFVFVTTALLATVTAAQEPIEQLLPDEPGAAILLSQSPDGGRVANGTGTAIWDAVDVGAGPALLVAVDADIAMLLVLERDSRPGHYNVFVHLPPRSGASVDLGHPIALRNAAGEILADDPHAVENGFVLTAIANADSISEDQDGAFIRRIIESAWLALSFESDNGALDLVFRPDIVAEATVDQILQLWRATDPPPSRSVPVLNRPLELSIGDDHFAGTGFWRTRVASVPTLQIGTGFDDTDLYFSIHFLYGFAEGFVLGVNTLVEGEVDESYKPTAFRVGTGEGYLPISAPIGITYEWTGWVLGFQPPSAADYQALVDASFFEIVLEHEGETLILRLDKSDPRGHAIVETMFGPAIDAYELQEREAAP